MPKRLPEEAFDLDLIEFHLVRVDIPANDTDAPFIFDVLRVHLGSPINDLLGWCPEDFESEAHPAPGTVQGFFFADEENQSLAEAVQGIRARLPEHKVRVTAISNATKLANRSL